jgi:ATP-dependent helicase/nuclease subunit B
MDRLADGSHALIDYKTGKSSVSAWLGERPDDPQLPLYGIYSNERLGAVAFAKVKVGEMKFEGLACGEELIPGAVTLARSRTKLAKSYASWEDLLAGWKLELEALGQGYASGDARIAPKDLSRTCELCDLKPLCRVYERFNALSLDSETVDAG